MSDVEPATDPDLSLDVGESTLSWEQRAIRDFGDVEQRDARLCECNWTDQDECACGDVDADDGELGCYPCFVAGCYDLEDA